MCVLKTRIERAVDFKGNQTVYTYLADGKLDEQRHFEPGAALTGTPAVRYKSDYDTLGRRESVTETRGASVVVTSYVYDPITGGVTSIISPQGTINYGYDPKTSRLVRTWTSSNDSAYSYDEFGRLKTITTSKFNGESVNLVTEHTNDDTGNLKTVLAPSGLLSTYTYDVLNRLDVLSIAKAGVSVFTQDFGLHADGQKSGAAETRFNADGSVFSTNAVTGRFKTGHRLARSKPASLVMRLVPHLDGPIQLVTGVVDRRRSRRGDFGTFLSTRRDCLVRLGVFRGGDPLTVGGTPPSF